MGSFKKYDLSKGADALHVLPFTFPGVKSTGETVTIRSYYSEEFREANSKAARQLSTMRSALPKGEEIDDNVVKAINDRAFAALVADWSFDEPCTIENIVEFFKANPHFFDVVNVSCANDSLFFKDEEKN